MVKVIDRRCGQIAFYFKRELNKGDRIEASNVILLDGSQPKPRDRIICGSCNQPFHGTHIPHLKIQSWKDWFIVKSEKDNYVS
jgi:hypothetical protein